MSSYNASPFQVTVQPAVFDLTRCDATGAGLTIATAGVSASVSVTLRDRFGNYQPSVSAGSITLILNYGTAAFEVTDCFGGSCPSTMAGPFITSPPFVAFPSAKPVYILSYITTTSGLYVPAPPSPPLFTNVLICDRYALGVVGTKVFAAGSSRLANGIAGSPFELTVAPSLPCASLSTFAVSPLSAAPEKVLSVRLISRDAYGNPQSVMPLAVGRSSSASAIDTVANAWTSSTSAAASRVRNRYDAALLSPTTAGTNTVFGFLGIPGSLIATYYSGAASTVNVFPSSIDFSVASGGVFQTFSATFSARYAGAVALSPAAVHTFKIRNVGTADRFSLVVANKVVIDMMSVAPAANADTSATLSLPPSCDLYDVLLQYVCTGTSTGRGVTLSVISNGVYVVPQQSSWFATYVVASIPVEISTGRVCASKCSVVGYSVTASALTAGVPSSFTIQAVDSWGNLLTTSDDVFQFASVPYFTQDTVTRSTFSFHPPAATTSSQLNVNDAAYDDLSLTVAASVAPLGSGRYAVSYRVTRSGWYFIRGRLTQAGGLYGVYYDSTLLAEGGGSALAQPAAQRVDAVIDFDWGAASPLDNWPPGV